MGLGCHIEIDIKVRQRIFKADAIFVFEVANIIRVEWRRRLSRANCVQRGALLRLPNRINGQSPGCAFAGNPVLT